MVRGEALSVWQRFVRLLTRKSEKTLEGMIGKRHLLMLSLALAVPAAPADDGVALKPETVLVKRGEVEITSVSYTHLTLPTKRIV